MKTPETTIPSGGGALAETTLVWPPPSLADVLVVDVETSGLDPRRHGVLGIGAMKPDGSELYIETWLPPGREFDLGALRVNGRPLFAMYSELEVPGARVIPPNGGVVEVLAEFLWEGMPASKWRLAGANVGKFDWWFLALMDGWPKPGDCYAMEAWVKSRTLDLGTVAAACELAGIFPPPGNGWSADAIFEACGLGPEPRPHNARTGARKTMTALRHMATALTALRERSKE